MHLGAADDLVEHDRTASDFNTVQAASTLARRSGSCVSPELVTRSSTSRVSCRGSSGR
jgi:hypothetical protein